MCEHIISQRRRFLFPSLLVVIRRGLAGKVPLRGGIPVPPHLHKLSSKSEITEARAWIDEFRKTTLREVVELSFSRSSGPGGQNVNKVNTKCTARCALSAEWIPSWARESLRKSTAYAPSSNSLLITSSTHRSQAQNIDDCLTKLQSLIITASLSGIKNEASEEQKEHVRDLQKIEKMKRRQDKDYRSQLKKSRTASRDDWD